MSIRGSELPKLSGWARLWIVGAIVVWSIGAWWFTENEPRRRFVPIASIECDQAYGEGGSLNGLYIRGCQFDRQTCQAMLRQCYADAAKPENVATKIALIVVAPFVLGLAALLLYFVGQWVRQGFKRRAE